MAKLNIELPKADELGIIRYLIDEIEKERKYNKDYPKAYQDAQKKASDDLYRDHWYYLMLAGYTHEPRQSVIKDDIKMIRRLSLKILGGKE